MLQSNTYVLHKLITKVNRLLENDKATIKHFVLKYRQDQVIPQEKIISGWH